MKSIETRTFDELMADVSVDLYTYNNEGMIDASQLLKTAIRINHELGLKIHRTKEVVLDVELGKAKLPSDFYRLNTAFLCGKYLVVNQVPSGTDKEDVLLDSAACTKCGEPDPTCSCEKTYTVCNNKYIKVVEKKKFETREYTQFHKLYISPSRYTNGYNYCNPSDTMYRTEIKDGFLYVSGVSYSKVYISYESTMEDQDGNLLVLDHPQINEYYESALKERILYNLYINGEDVERKWKMVQEETMKAKRIALSIVNMPDFNEMFKVFLTNRRYHQVKYFDFFKND